VLASSTPSAYESSSGLPAATKPSDARPRSRLAFGLAIAVAAPGALAAVSALTSALQNVQWNVGSPSYWHAMLQACLDPAAVPLRPPLILVALLVLFGLVVLSRGVRGVWRQARAQRVFLRALRVVGPHPQHADVTVVCDETPRAFCAGYLRPRIYVSSGALRALGDRSLTAVLAHERQHRASRDPLRFAVTRVLADALFFLPVLGRLSEDCAALAELDADAAALRSCAGDRSALAVAMLSFAEPAVHPAVVGIAPERVDHLAGEAPQWRLPRRPLGIGVVTSVCLGAVALLTQGVVAGPIALPGLSAQLCMAMMLVLPALVAAVATLVVVRTVRRLI
jgi:Zn-dependent protease with chaperone function